MSETLVHDECGAPVIRVADLPAAATPGPYRSQRPFTGWPVRHGERWFGDDAEEREVAKSGAYEGTMRTVYVTVCDYLCPRCNRAISHNRCIPQSEWRARNEPRPVQEAIPMADEGTAAR